MVESAARRCFWIISQPLASWVWRRWRHGMGILSFKGVCLERAGVVFET